MKQSESRYLDSERMRYARSKRINAYPATMGGSNQFCRKYMGRLKSKQALSLYELISTHHVTKGLRDECLLVKVLRLSSVKPGGESEHV